MPLTPKLRTFVVGTFLFLRFLLIAFFEAVVLVWSRVTCKQPKTPNRFLSGNFGPVFDELTARSLPVKGNLPADLLGEFVRNGPNPRWDNNAKKDLLYHWFDGDGMIHGVHITKDGATYVNRYVRTQRWKEEDEAGERISLRLGDMLSPLSALFVIFRVLKWQVFTKKGKVFGEGTANTALEYHDGRLLALVESNVPHHVKMPMLQTVGKYDYNGALEHPFTAHPKVDAKTGEMMFFGYNIQKKPYVQYSVVSREGELLRTVPIDLDVPVMMHDFAVTEHHSIFMNLPFTFRKERILYGQSPYVFEDDRSSWFGILPRHAKDQSEMKWFESTSCFVFHVLNSYEEDDGQIVVVIACRSESTSVIGLNGNNEEITMAESHQPFLYRWSFNLATGEVLERQLSDYPCEFPRINESLIGYQQQFGYVMRLKENFLLDAVVKLKFDDNEKTTSTVFEFGEHKSAGECVFVPRQEPESEDDGYLLTFVYDDQTDSTEMWILDAKNFGASSDDDSGDGEDTNSSIVLAKVEIPRRIPYGFHGKWVGQEQIDQQK